MVLTPTPRIATMAEDDMKRVISGISSSRAHEDPSACITALDPLIGRSEGRRFLSKQVGEMALILIELFDWALRSHGKFTKSTRGFMLWTLRQLCAFQGTLPQSCILPIEFKTTDPHHAAGGFADVWKDTYEGRELAFKTLRSCAQADNATHLRRKRRFCKEVVLWRALNHPNILGLVGVCRWDDTPDAKLTMISEWMENGNITEYIKHKDAYRMQLLTDCARGVQYLHRMNLVHGDLKGANILITSHNPVRACLADFGFTTIVHDDADGSAGTSAQGGGTTPFMAPELLCPSKFGKTKCQVSKEADVYAFGIAILQVLTGSMPFHTLRDPEIAYKVIQGERPPMPANHKALGISDELWELLSRCWHADATQRPPINEMFQHLCNDPAQELIFPPSPTHLPPNHESAVSNTQKYGEMFVTAKTMQTPIEDYSPLSMPMSPVDSTEYPSNGLGSPASLLSLAQIQNTSPATSPGNSQIRTEDPKQPESETPSRIVPTTPITTESTVIFGASRHAQTQGRLLRDFFPPQRDPIIYDAPHVNLAQIPVQVVPRPLPRSDPPWVKPRLKITTATPLESRHSDDAGVVFRTLEGSDEAVDEVQFDSAVPIQVTFSGSGSRSGDAAGPLRRVADVQQKWNSMYPFPTQPGPLSLEDQNTTDASPRYGLRMTLARPPKINPGPPRYISGASASTILDREPGSRPRSRLAIHDERRDVGTSKEATIFPRQNGKRAIPRWDNGEEKEEDDWSHRSASTDYVSVFGGGEEHSRENSSTPPPSNPSLFQQLLKKSGIREYPQSIEKPTVDSGRDRERTLSRFPSFQSLRSGLGGVKRKESKLEMSSLSGGWSHMPTKHVVDSSGS